MINFRNYYPKLMGYFLMLLPYKCNIHLWTRYMLKLYIQKEMVVFEDLVLVQLLPQSLVLLVEGGQKQLEDAK